MAIVLVFTAVVSCEKDFTDIGSSIVNNTKFDTEQVVLDLEIKSINTESIIADNIGLPRLQNNSFPSVDYWLGVYNSNNAKKIEAGFVSQLGLVSNLKNRQEMVDGDTIFNLDKVVLKIPYTSVSLGVNSNGVPIYRLDSILGNTSINTTLEVYRNPTFLYGLKPLEISKQNSYLSNFDYEETELLTATTGFSFIPQATDTIFTFDRIDRRIDVNSTAVVKDTLRVTNTAGAATPFLAIPLDINKMKTLFWDKFNDVEFSSSREFQNYFKGIIVKAKGTDGALVPFNLTPNSNFAVDFLYSKTVKKEGEDNEVIKEAYSFSLGGIQNSIYKTEDINTVPVNNFVIQGTAGFSAEVKILGVNLLNLSPEDPFLAFSDKDLDNNNYLDLKEIASIRDIENNEFGFLINDADLTFAVNSALSTNSDLLPQRLYIYKNKDNGNGGVTPTHLSDSYEEGAFFSGVLSSTEEEVPESYTFKITDYISDLVDGSSDDFSSLTLKVYNSTDNPIITGALNVNVLQYNWNPRSVVLFDENGEKKAQLKVSYIRKKN